MNLFSRLFILLIFLWSSASLQAQNLQEIILQDLRVDVIYLASDYLEGRETGTRGEALAAQYIASRMDALGLAPAGPGGSWFQHFEANFRAHPHAPETEKRQARNVLGYLDRGAQTTVVIGAHYDHIGHGDFGSRHTGEPEIHNGADDNASGVAVMLSLARMLTFLPELQGNNFLFIAFSGEEMGLLGSKYFVNHATIDTARINYMLNFDMVGRLSDEKTLIVNGAGTSPAWKPAMEAITYSPLQIKTHDSGIGASDHSSFYLAGIPAVHFFTGQTNDYHKPSDDSHLVNYEGAYEICSFVISMIMELDSKGRLEYTKTKDEQEGRQAARFKVSLGIMPDYVFEGTGLRIDGVQDNRPGALAGLQSGDILLGIGDHNIENIYDYMEGLSLFESGQKSTLRVLRKGEVLQLPVAF
jgi:hypothetical protein